MFENIEIINIYEKVLGKKVNFGKPEVSFNRGSMEKQRNSLVL